MGAVVKTEPIAWLDVKIFCDSTASSGTDISSVGGLRAAFEKLGVPSALIQLIAPAELERLEHDPSKRVLLVFPGGICSKWDEKVTAVGQQAIRRFVEAGNHCLGICAGGFYTSSLTVYEGLVPKPREIGFYPKAVGPLKAGSGLTPHAVQIRWERTGVMGWALVAGGGSFELPLDHDCEVLATYQDAEHSGQIAAVAAKIGSGQSFAMMFHPEWSSSLGLTTLDALAAQYPKLNLGEVAAQLAATPQFGLNCLKRVLDRIMQRQE